MVVKSKQVGESCLLWILDSLNIKFKLDDSSRVTILNQGLLFDLDIVTTKSTSCFNAEKHLSISSFTLSGAVVGKLKKRWNFSSKDWTYLTACCQANHSEESSCARSIGLFITSTLFL